jgi:signal peptide peptidase SppA
MGPDVWAIEPASAHRLFTAIDKVDFATRAELAAKDLPVDNGWYRNGKVAVVPIVGTITKRASWWSWLFANASTTAVSAALGEAVADDQVQSIVLKIESPGGSVIGVADLAERIRRAGQSKPITAFVEDLGASGAYWLASAAGRVVINPSGWTGAIGSWAAFYDVSAQFAAAGVHAHVVRSAPYKGLGAPGEPIGEFALAAWQHQVDVVHARFVRAVATGRRLPVDFVAGLATGELIGAPRAMREKMVDQIALFEDVVAELSRPTPGEAIARSRAQAAEKAKAALVDKALARAVPKSWKTKLTYSRAELERMSTARLEVLAGVDDE